MMRRKAVKYFLFLQLMLKVKDFKKISRKYADYLHHINSLPVDFLDQNSKVFNGMDGHNGEKNLSTAQRDMTTRNHLKYPNIP
jgi:hypothetical protein